MIGDSLISLKAWKESNHFEYFNQHGS